MTVCIGALCAAEDGTSSGSVVVASDRMVTMGGLIEFEHEVPKLMNLTNCAVGLIAGDALRGARLGRGLLEATQAGSPPIGDLAQMAATLYGELRRKQINSEIFAPRGIAMEHFYTGGLQPSLLSTLVGLIDSQVMNWNYGVDFMIAGVDDTGGRLYIVSNPGGSYTEFGQIGFAAIGSGTIHAIQSMIGFGHTGARDLHQTLFEVYVSKRRAEAAPGVGRDTDLAIVARSGITKLDRSTLDELETLYLEYQLPAAQEVREKVAQMSIFRKEEADASDK